MHEWLVSTLTGVSCWFYCFIEVNNAAELRLKTKHICSISKLTQFNSFRRLIVFHAKLFDARMKIESCNWQKLQFRDKAYKSNAMVSSTLWSGDEPRINSMSTALLAAGNGLSRGLCSRSTWATWAGVIAMAASSAWPVIWALLLPTLASVGMSF